MNDETIRENAIAFAKKHRTAIAKAFTDPNIYPAEAEPVSVFMAGSPGAGKTEASIELLDHIAVAGDRPVLRIDPDELRSQFSGYTGDNSWLFQFAVSLLVERIHDRALKNRQSFLLDGTLSHLEVARKNIHRSLNKGRFVQVLYVYQYPQLAWDFVQKRERVEGRRIRPETFVEQYFGARSVVNQLKQEFGKRIQVDLLMKNLDGSHRLYEKNIERIDKHVPEIYSRDELSIHLLNESTI